MNEPKPAEEAETPPCVPNDEVSIPHDDGSLFDDGSGYNE